MRPAATPVASVSGDEVRGVQAAVQSLVFADGGDLLIANAYGALLAIDPVERAVVTTQALSSPMIDDPNGRPGAGERLLWQIGAVDRLPRV